MVRKFINMYPLIFIIGVFTTTKMIMVQCEDIELINKCSYSANRRILNCIGLENASTDVALFVTPGTQMLFLRETRKLILPINHHAHTNYLNLVGYQILNSKFFFVNPGAFLGLSNVQHMEIHRNDWNVIDDNTFVGLRSLTIMSLSDNRIKKLNTYAFNHLNKLLSLDLSENLLEVIPSYVFQGLDQLETLYINNNLVKNIEEHAFQGLPKLNLLFLTNNSLGELDTKDFNTLSVSYLNFNFNKIGYIRGQLKLSNLKFLQLSNNVLNNLESNIFEKCPVLLSIDLSGNSLKNITEEPFLSLKKLKHLNLLNNFIDMIGFKNLKNDVLIIHN